MHFFTVLASALTIASSAATFLPGIPGLGAGPVPGYPFGLGCLNDQQANFIAEQFRQILASPNRNESRKIANYLIGDDYTETSDSINMLAGWPLGSSSFGKQSFIEGVVASPALTGMSTIRVFHDCNQILWQWRVVGLGSGKYPVKGLNVFVVNPSTGVIKSTDLEFNSIAWGIDTFAITCTLPPPQPR